MSSQLLPVHELIRRLRLHSTRRGNIKAIAGMGEIHYQHLRQITREGRMSVRMQALLSDILERVDRKEIIIKLNLPNAKDNANKTLIEERPPDAPWTQRRIVRANEYSPWARCIACGGTHFSPLRRTLSHKTSAITYYACDSCVDTPDRVMMGDRSST
jgi:hypothetical protein